MFMKGILLFLAVGAVESIDQLVDSINNSAHTIRFSKELSKFISSLESASGSAIQRPRGITHMPISKAVVEVTADVTRPDR
jgi:hypothetical protein